MRTLLTWTGRLLLVAALAAVAGRVVRSAARSGQTDGGILPPIVGDTWPPVPTNPDRDRDLGV